MDELEINRLFARVKNHTTEVPKGAERVFSKLVSTTLQHRDRLKTELGTILTVEDVRVTLDWLMQFLGSKQIPVTNNAIRRDLLMIWIEALKASA